MYMLPGNIWVFSTAIVMALASIILFGLNKKIPALIFLAGAAFIIRLYMAHMDAFLHDWDEKYHALVARNMMDNPFRPILKNGLSIPYDYKSWCCNYIWVHKQPLFMWQMALGMKLFGVSEYAIRYPDVLMGTLMVLMLYRIGKLVTGNDTIGFMAAMFLCFSNYQLELISGVHGMDHNDVAFGFYVLASIWAYTEYIKTGKFKWVVLVGIFAGGAVLNKWLTGLMVFSGWAVNILLHIRNKDTRREIGHMLAALIICTVVFLPWQLYILHTFPQEAAYELSYNSRHLFEAVEGHKGDEWFYWNHFPEYINIDLWKIVPAGIILAMVLKKYRGRYSIAVVVPLLAAYCFFSFMVTSKLQSYMFVVVPLMFIMMAITTGTVLQWIRVPVFVQVILAGYFSFLLLNTNSIKNKHDPDDSYRQAKIHNTKVYKELKDAMPADVKVVSNLPEFADVECMFYNKGITAYHYNPSRGEFKMLLEQRLRVAAFKDHSKYWIPEYMLDETPYMYVIRRELK